MRRHLSEASWAIVAVFTVGLVVRLLFATVLVPRLERGANRGPDADHYAELAKSILDRGELGFDPPGASPTSLRGPGFPAWLAAGMLIGGRSPGWIAFWASVPGLAAALAIAGMLGRSHGRTAGLLGGLLCAAHPLACFVSARVLPDEFYGGALFLGLAAWSCSSGAERSARGLVWASAAGVLLSVASLTRVTAVFVLIVLLGAAFCLQPRRVRSGAVIAVVATALLTPWAVRTSLLVGRPAYVESLAGYNFWLGESADRYGFGLDFGSSRARAHELMALEAGTETTRVPMFWYASLPPREARAFDEKLVTAGLRCIGGKPWPYVRRCFTGLLWFWIRAETAKRTVQYSLVALPLLALALFGASRRETVPRPGAIPKVLIAAVVLIHVVIYAAICPMARYSVEAYPLLCYLAGSALGSGPRLR